MSARVLALMLASSMAANAAAQQPRDRVQSSAAGTARIAGTVVSAPPEEKPLRRARVTLNGGSLQPGRTTITADDGTFAFDRLPPGRYTLTVAKAGYVSTTFGASRPGRPGVPVAVASAEQRSITMVVPRGGVITGMLSDTDGQPAAGVQVSAFTYRFVPPGERRLMPAFAASRVTDDRGVYRIFGLPAGEYVVAAHARAAPGAEPGLLRTVTPAEVRQALSDMRQGRAAGRPAASPAQATNRPEAGRAVAFAQIFYPGTANATRARMVTVGAGEEQSSIDFQLDYVPTARVSGTVMGGSGGLAGAYLRLMLDREEAGIEPGFRGTTTGAGGTFTFENIPPGRYILAARASSDGTVQARYNPSTAIWASTEIVVDGQDIAGVVVTPQPGLTLNGRLVFQGQRPAPPLADFKGLGLPLTPTLSLGGQPVAEIAPDGRFSIKSVPPGTYRPDFMAGVRNPIGGWWLKSITMDGREVLDAPLDFRRSTDDVVVTFSDAASELSGRVQDPDGMEAPNRMVVVFPADKAGWFFNSRRIAAVPSDPQGRYAIRNLPAGDYLVVVHPDLDPLQWFDPLALQRLAPTAASVTMRDNDRMTYDITVPSR